MAPHLYLTAICMVSLMKPVIPWLNKSCSRWVAWLGLNCTHLAVADNPAQRMQPALYMHALMAHAIMGQDRTATCCEASRFALHAELSVV